MTSFSERYGYAPADPDISIREDAPEELRSVVVDIAYEAGLDPHGMRSLVCRILRRREDPGNWSAFPNVDGEVRGHLDSCQWYEVYDVIEAISSKLTKQRDKDMFSNEELSFEPDACDTFAAEVNRYFQRRGIGWQLQGGRIETRGSETFEAVLHQAKDCLADSGHSTSSTELTAAIQDLSRRPAPDVTGAIQHSMAALECYCREIALDPKSTLGALLSSRRDLFPPPIDDAVVKLWGFASERGRHLREGRTPEVSVQPAMSNGAWHTPGW